MALFHLDANWLIAIAELYHTNHVEADSAVKRWLMDGHQIATSSIAWNEFLTGEHQRRSVDDAMRCEYIINGGIVAVGEAEAEKAAELFNQTGRKKRVRMDCFIAATAIVAKAELATFNVNDFKKFQPFGLSIANFPVFPSMNSTADEGDLVNRHHTQEGNGP